MIINHNLNAMNAHRNMAVANTKQGNAMEKLSSGTRINRAADDAAGLAISEKMRSQIRGLNQASRNAQNGVSMIQTAEGALSEMQSLGQRMREIAIQSSNGTYTDEDRKLIDQEFGQLKKEIDRIADDTEFNGSKVLNGDKSGKSINYDKSKGSTKYIKGETFTTDDNIKAIFNNSVTGEELAKLGEGTFSVKLTVGEKGKNETIKVELLDKSKFNGNKEYVMDEVIIDKNTKHNGTAGSFDVKLSGITVKLSNLMSQGGKAESGKIGGITFTNKIEDKTEGMKLQIGASEDQSIGFDIDFMRSRELGLGGVTIDSVENAQEAVERIDEAINRISSQRSNLGAAQNRLEHTITSTENTAENLQAAESRIRDVDMAKEMMNLTKVNVLQQASQAMMSQANQAPQQVLTILK